MHPTWTALLTLRNDLGISLFKKNSNGTRVRRQSLNVDEVVIFNSHKMHAAFIQEDEPCSEEGLWVALFAEFDSCPSKNQAWVAWTDDGRKYDLTKNT